MYSQILVTFAVTCLLSSVFSEDVPTSTSQPQMPTPTPSTGEVPTQGRRPSIWSRTIHQHRQSGWIPTSYRKPLLRRSTEVRPLNDFNSLSFSTSKEENELLKSDAMVSLKDFANQLINETTGMFRSSAKARAYSTTDVATEDQSQSHQQQFWDDKDQAYHASSYSGVEYEPPTSYHHPFHHPPPPMYYHSGPQKKDDTLFTKVALIALLKLVLAKLKAIGFLKLILILMLKVPLFFFKMLIVFKGFKFLKLLSIPFLIAAFGLPFLPLLPFLFFAFIPFLFMAPLAIPLLLPLLMFLPIVPVTTPPTLPGTAPAGRRRRDVSLDMPQSVSVNQTASIMDEKWLEGRKKRMFKTRSRPASNARRFFKYDPNLTPEHNENLIELTQRVVSSQQCMERAACEIGKFNDSKIYQSAVVWALGKLNSYAPPTVQRRIEKYSEAYETGTQRRSGDYCAERFKCDRPKIFLVQGHHSFNLI